VDAPDWPVCDGPIPATPIEERDHFRVDALLSEGMPLSPELFNAPLRLLEPIPDLSPDMLRRLIALELSLRESIAVSSGEVELATDQA
jgi:hypothetical protein